MNPEDRAALARYRKRKHQLEAELKAVSLIIEGFQALEAMQPTQPTNDDSGDQLPIDSPPEEHDDRAAAEPAPVDPDVFMTARDATLRIYSERPGAYRAGQLADEVKRRGWVIDSTNPAQAIRTALLRLVEAGELERVGHGLYDIAKPSDDSSQSRSNGSIDRTGATRIPART